MTIAATVPSAPVLTATAGTSSVALSWTVPANGGSALTGYNVYRGTASGAETLLASVGATTTTDTDSSLAPGTTAYYEGDGGLGFNDLGFTTPADGVVVYGPAMSDNNAESRPGWLLLTSDGGESWQPVSF